MLGVFFSEWHKIIDLFRTVFCHDSRAPLLNKDTAGFSLWKGKLIGLQMLLERQWSWGFAGGHTDYPPATGNKVNV